MQKLSLYKTGIFLTGISASMCSVLLTNHLETMPWVLFKLGLTMLVFAILKLKEEKKTDLPTDRTNTIITAASICTAVGLGLSIMTIFVEM